MTEEDFTMDLRVMDLKDRRVSVTWHFQDPGYLTWWCDALSIGGKSLYDPAHPSPEKFNAVLDTITDTLERVVIVT